MGPLDGPKFRDIVGDIVGDIVSSAMGSLDRTIEGEIVDST